MDCPYSTGYQHHHNEQEPQRWTKIQSGLKMHDVQTKMFLFKAEISSLKLQEIFSLTQITGLKITNEFIYELSI